GKFRRRLEEKEVPINQLSREKSIFAQQIEEFRGQLEKETKTLCALAHALQSARYDCDLFRDPYNEEQEAKASSRSNAEMVPWRKKYKNYAIQGTEDLEDSKKKLAIRLQESAGAREVANARNASLESARLHLGDALPNLGKARSPAAVLVQKQWRLDKALGCLEKHEEAQVLLDISQKEAQALSKELLELKHANEESTVSWETLRRENKNLQEEISDLTNQVKKGNKNLSEMEKVKKLMEQEKTEVQVVLEEAEGALERNKSKILCFQLKLLDAKAELQRKLSQKDEEMKKLKEPSKTELVSHQTCLFDHFKAGSDILEIKKKHSKDLNGKSQIWLRILHRQASDATKALGQFQVQTKSLQVQLDDSMHLDSDLKEQVAVAESELEELRALQRLAEEELLEATERIHLFHSKNTSLLSQKKKLQVAGAQEKKKAEEVEPGCQNAEEKAMKAVPRAANISEELKKEQDPNAHLERIRNNMEQTIKDFKKRLDEAKQTFLKGSRKQFQKLESRV
uniref:Myosin tail domain-containing protein n=1 Tax=Loxodonta africana TaxID=9785 RepID=G3TPX8_LOXAF